jgi:glycyl-tRNA synthetase
MEVMVDGQRFIPHVLELSFGVDRNLWALLDNGYEMGDRTVLHLPPRLAPVVAGVFPLVNRAGMPEKARKILEGMRLRLPVAYDDSGSIGRRYARMDEVGTPYCITVDHDTLEGRGVTLRDRETTAQARVPEDGLARLMEDLLAGRVSFGSLPPEDGK